MNRITGKFNHKKRTKSNYDNSILTNVINIAKAYGLFVQRWEELPYEYIEIEALESHPLNDVILDFFAELLSYMGFKG